MPFDPERLRALAEAAQARDEENAARELAQFKSERLAAFSEWLSVELERMAGYGLRSVTLQFDSALWTLRGKTAFNEPAEHELSCWYAYLGRSHGDRPADQVFWVGPNCLPIGRVEGCVIESAGKAGISVSRDSDGITFSW